MARATGRAWWIVAAAGVMLAPAGRAAACPGDEGTRTVQALVGASDLVFHGVVARIAYANSAPAPDAPGGIPYTFVTYRVERVLRGAVAGDEVTLRFFGGYDRTDGTYLAASVSPQFDTGDEDLLFVRGNGELGCPLVGNACGRLRVIGGQVYTEWGQAVTLGADGGLRRGRTHRLEAVATTRVMGEVLRLHDAPRADPGPSHAMFLEDVLPPVLMAAVNAPAPAAAFESMDPGVPFESRFPAPAPMREKGNGGGAGVVPAAR